MIGKFNSKYKRMFAEALDVIEKSGYQIAIVTNKNGLLKGIVTDSDIRKDY